MQKQRSHKSSPKRDPAEESKTKLERLLARKPLVLVRFDETTCDQLRQSRDGLRRFTITQRHQALTGIKAPTLCIAELSKDGVKACYLGVIRRKDAVATVDSRLSFLKLRRIPFGSLEKIGDEITERRFRKNFQEQFSDSSFAVALTPGLGERLMDIIWARSAAVVSETVNDLPGFALITGPVWQLDDATDLAKSIFGLSAADIARSEDPDFEDDFSDVGAHLQEDNVIARDASEVPGYELLAKSVTGRSVFQKNHERLVIYTANRGPLEKMLGVDLIYINETHGNIVMVQYKMLDEHRDAKTDAKDWVFRPDAQLKKERARMKLPPATGKPSDYRLNRQPFYFKFVKRKNGVESDKSVILSLDHFDRVLTAPELRGPRGGVRFSYDALGGQYLRELDLIGLIRSGYIGTHRGETDVLRPFIDQVNKGKRGLVLAWQHPVKRPEPDTSDPF